MNSARHKTNTNRISAFATGIRATLFAVFVSTSVIVSMIPAMPLAAEEVPAQVATEALAETPVAPAEPTAMPTMVPTVASEPVQPQEPAPAPTFVPTAAPTAMPTMVPPVVPAPTSTPAPAPSPTVAPTAMATPAPVTRSSLIAPASIDPGQQRITGCRTLDSDDLLPGKAHSASCQITTWGSHPIDLTVTPPTSLVQDAALGWQVRLTSGSVSTDWVSTKEVMRLPSGSSSFTVSLLAPINRGVPGAEVTAAISLAICNSGNRECESGATTISARLAAPAAPDLSGVTVTCDPANPLVSRGASQEITCALNAPSDLREAAVLVRSVTISAPGGWAVTTSSDNPVGDGGAVTITPDPSTIIEPGGSWPFTMRLAPACSAPAAGGWTITARVAPARGSVVGENVTLSDADFYATATNGNQTVTASVTGSSLNRTFTASFGDQSQPGSLTYRVTGASCSKWSVSVVAGPFTLNDEPVASPGAGNLGLVSTGAPVAESGKIDNVRATGVTGSLDSERPVLEADAGSGNGTYTQELGFSITIPGNTPVGLYSSTITVNTATAP